MCRVIAAMWMNSTVIRTSYINITYSSNAVCSVFPMLWVCCWLAAKFLLTGNNIRYWNNCFHNVWVLCRHFLVRYCQSSGYFPTVFLYLCWPPRMKTRTVCHSVRINILLIFMSSNNFRYYQSGEWQYVNLFTCSIWKRSWLSSKAQYKTTCDDIKHK